MNGKLFALVIIIVGFGLIEVLKFVYNHFKLEEEILDLRRRLGR